MNYDNFVFFNESQKFSNPVLTMPGVAFENKFMNLQKYKFKEKCFVYNVLYHCTYAKNKRVLTGLFLSSEIIKLMH